jgi:hypothetical protein
VCCLTVSDIIYRVADLESESDSSATTYDDVAFYYLVYTAVDDMHQKCKRQPTYSYGSSYPLYP